MKFSLNKIYYTPREILHFHHFSMLLWAGNLFLLLELCRDNNYNPLNIFESYLDRNWRWGLGTNCEFEHLPNFPLPLWFSACLWMLFISIEVVTFNSPHHHHLWIIPFNLPQTHPQQLPCTIPAPLLRCGNFPAVDHRMLSYKISFQFNYFVNSFTDPSCPKTPFWNILIPWINFLLLVFACSFFPPKKKEMGLLFPPPGDSHWLPFIPPGKFLMRRIFHY